MILAVITALALMESAGGLDYLVAVAEKLLRSNPQRIGFIAPLVTYVLIFAAGTQHVIYSLLPVIAEVSRKAGVRPERPMSISVIAAQQGLVASPISAVTVALVGALAGLDISLPQVMMVTVPATLVGVLLGTLSVAWRGPDLKNDPEYQARLQEEAADAAPTDESVGAPDASNAGAKDSVAGQGSLIVFLTAVTSVVFIGIFPELRPVYETAPDGAELRVAMPSAIMIIMLAAAGLIALLFGASPAAAVSGKLMRSGVVAVVSILGVSWLGSSFFTGNEEQIVGTIAEVIERAPYLFGLGLFVLSILLFSQAATIVILAPVGVALGLSAPMLVGLYPAVNGLFFLPTYGTVLAAVSFDQTGTTRIGKYVINHSFMRPGLVATGSATLTALALSQLIID
jgi:anaerobic C4-dicarboxylate transporter DcuA